VERNKDLELEELVQRAQDGDARAFEDLMKRFQKRIFFAVMRVVNDMHLADDLTQEVFLKAHRSMGRLQTPATFAAWLHRIALNHALDARKKLKRRKEREVSGGEFEWLQAPTDPALRDVLDDVEGLKGALGKAIAQLPKGQKVVLEMSLDVEVNHEDIAAVLGIPRGTVKSRLHHARKFLFEKLRGFMGR
jgi:RNA polymerase sigma-70 factor (ECF subfamily)